MTEKTIWDKKLPNRLSKKDKKDIEKKRRKEIKKINIK